MDERIVNFICCVPTCGFQSSDSKSIVKHLKNHIRPGTIISCPFLTCSPDFSNLNTFFSHLSRCHLSSTQSARVVQISIPTASQVVASTPSTLEIFPNSQGHESTPSTSEIFLNLPAHSHETNETSVKSTYAAFFAMLQYELLIPVRTINRIIEGQLKINHQVYSSVCETIQTILRLKV